MMQLASWILGERVFAAFLAKKAYMQAVLQVTL